MTEGVTGGLEERLAAIRLRVSRATAATGRPESAVTLVAVSKTYPRSDIDVAIAWGQTVFGENRTQEAARKFAGAKLTCPELRLHLIGGIQTNKARDAVRLADVIETVDRPRLADAIADAAQREGRMPDLCVQVNVGDEPQKGGVDQSLADSFIEACQLRFGERLVGVMCIPPAASDPTPHFSWLAACAARHGLGMISMGMSGDFECAIAQGATHVRVGTAIFGSRT